MGATLIQPCRVNDEGLGCKVFSWEDHDVAKTRPNSVPAADAEVLVWNYWA